MTEIIRSPEALKALRDQARTQIELRGGEKDVSVTVHMGTCGIAAGAREVLSEVMTELERAAATNVSVRQSGCLGLCDREPMMTVADRCGKRYVYGKLNQTKVRTVVREHVLGGVPVPDCLVKS
jgi:NADP-reducing hydrogenase subunit HndB